MASTTKGAVQNKIENFHLPSQSSVIALTQFSKVDGRKDSFTINNNGHVNIDVEVLHSTRNIIPEKQHYAVVAPNQSHTFELDEHFNRCALKVINYDENEEAVFSAEGGHVPEQLESSIDKLPTDECETKIENLTLPPRSTVLAMIQNSLEGDYTVTNSGIADVFVEIVHLIKQYDDGNHVRIVKPNETVVVPVDNHFKKNGLRLTNYSDKDDVIVTAEGGHVIHGAKHTIEPLQESYTIDSQSKKIEKSTLAPRSSVTIMTQCCEGDITKLENYNVTNHGYAPFEAEVLHPKSSDDAEGNIHQKVVNPGDSVVFELDDHFQLTVLRIINPNYKESIIFSAEGGIVVDGFEELAEKLPEPDGSHLEEPPKDIERARLNTRSKISVMFHDPSDESAEKHEGFTITNHGSSDIEAHVIHTEKDTREHDQIQVIKPNESTLLKHLEDAGKTALNIINKSFKELAIFSAKGGKVIHGFEHMITKITSEHEKLKQVKRFRLSPRSYVVVLNQCHKEDNQNEESHHHQTYIVCNKGHYRFVAEVFHKNGDEEEVIRTEIVNPNDTAVIELDKEIHESSLKIINKSFKEIVVFSAEGADVIPGYDRLVKALPDSEEDRKLEDRSSSKYVHKSSHHDRSDSKHKDEQDQKHKDDHDHKHRPHDKDVEHHKGEDGHEHNDKQDQEHKDEQDKNKHDHKHKDQPDHKDKDDHKHKAEHEN